MKTDDLISLLSGGAGAAPQLNVGKHLAPAVVGGLLAAVLLSGTLLGWVPQHMLSSPALWFKLGYAGALAAAAGWLAARLARPLAHTCAPRATIIGVLACIVVVGVLALLLTPPDEHAQAVLGRTWLHCPLIIPALSLPALWGSLATLRRLAPTRSRHAGFAAGLLAGALGAIGYSLHCPEESLTFVAIWYTIGMLASGALGALLGPRLLRW